jgi:hypothetical protein
MLSQRFWPVTIWTVLLTGLAFALLSFASGKRNDLLSACRFFLAEVRRCDALDGEEEQGRRIDQDKRRIAEEVIAGRMTLRQAAAEFDVLQRQRFGKRYDLVMRITREYQGDDVITRNVLSWVQFSLYNQPARAVTVMDRLQKEYEEGAQGQETAHGS